MTLTNSKQSGVEKVSEDVRLRQLLLLHSQIMRLLREIERLPIESRTRPNRSLVLQYNRFREQALVLTSNPDLMTLAPRPAWYLQDEFLVMILLGSCVIGFVEIYTIWELGDLSQQAGLVLLTIGTCIIAAVSAGAILFRLTRRGQGVFAASTQEVADQAVQLVAYVQENIVLVDPAFAASLPEILLVQIRNDVDPGRPFAAAAAESAMPAIAADSERAKSSRLAESEHQHLEIQLREQQERYGQLTVRIAAVTDDLGREVDGERELLLKDRLAKLIKEREQVLQTLRETGDQA